MILTDKAFIQELFERYKTSKDTYKKSGETIELERWFSMQNVLETYGYYPQDKNGSYELKNLRAGQEKNGEMREMTYTIVKEWRRWKDDDFIDSEDVEYFGDDEDGAFERAEYLNMNESAKWMAGPGEWEYTCYAIHNELFMNGSIFGDDYIEPEDLGFDKNEIAKVSYELNVPRATYSAHELVTPDGKHSDILVITKDDGDEDGNIEFKDYWYGATSMTDDEIGELLTEVYLADEAEEWR